MNQKTKPSILIYPIIGTVITYAMAKLGIISESSITDFIQLVNEKYQNPNLFFAYLIIPGLLMFGFGFFILYPRYKDTINKHLWVNVALDDLQKRLYFSVLTLGVFGAIFFVAMTVFEDNTKKDLVSFDVKPEYVTCEYRSSNHRLGTTMTLEQAQEIGNQYGCSDIGSYKNSNFCNTYTNKWWIDIEPNNQRPLCNPACVVDLETNTAKVDWRCSNNNQSKP